MHCAQQPQIILLKEGTDTSQGKPQLISNINACMAVADTVRTTLGPRGMDKLIHNERVRGLVHLDAAHAYYLARRMAGLVAAVQTRLVVVYTYGRLKVDLQRAAADGGAGEWIPTHRSCFLKCIPVAGRDYLQ